MSFVQEVERLARLRPFTVAVPITMTPPAYFEGAIPVLRAMGSNPAVLEALLRRAISETYLLAYRERFLRGMPGAVNLRSDRTATRPNPGVSDATRDAVHAAYDALNAAERPSDRLLERLRKAQARMRRDLKPRPRSHPLSTGQFRTLALDVMELFASVHAVQSRTTAGTIKLGVGHIATLDQIETPSATEGGSASPFNILWRHLEFGTGVYARPQPNGGSPFRLASGGWWYGARKGDALNLRGSQGVHALYRRGSQLPYTQDGMRFRSVFAGLMRQALGG